MNGLLSSVSLTRVTCQVSEAAKRALAELRKSRPDVDESNLKVDIPVAQALPRVPVPPYPALGFNGGMPLPAYRRGGVMDPLAAGLVMGGGVGMGGMGAGMGAGIGPGDGIGNPFMFGADQAHQFVAPAHGGLFRAGLGNPPVPEAAIPEPVYPQRLQPVMMRLPLAAPAQPVAAAGGGGRRRKGR